MDDWEKREGAIEERIMEMALKSDDPQWALAWTQLRMGSYLSCIDDSLRELRDAVQQVAEWDITLIGRAGE